MYTYYSFATRNYDELALTTTNPRSFIRVQHRNAIVEDILL